jgi:DNA repair protein RadD
MKLRPRQEEFVVRCLAALRERGNTLGVAPTGAGKTVMLSATAGELGGTNLIVQHRDELVEQNRRTFWLVNPKVQSDVFNADRKRLVRDGATFAMIQTLARNLDLLDQLPPIDNVTVDEAHHIAAASYLRTIDRIRKRNPAVRVFGVSATPERGDKLGLRAVFNNVADQISLTELIGAGHLVRPRTFVVDLGVQDKLGGVKRSASDFDMTEVEKIMDHELLNDRIVEEWKKLASNRLTVAFAATIPHAQHVADAFRAGGVKADVVHGDMNDGDRKRVLAAFDRGEFQVLVNVAVLTEGWDCQPVSCVVLLRPSSYKSTMIQMIGRGLRKLDPEKYPGWPAKDDCVVIDFGTSILTHGSIEQEISLDGKGGVKVCPECQSTIPGGARTCAICGHEFPREAPPTKTCEPCGHENPVQARLCSNCGHEFPEKESKGELSEFVLTEIDLLNQSPYRWESMFDGIVMVASAFDAWAMIVSFQGRWHALGGCKGEGIKHLANEGDRIVALASADDFLRVKGDTDGAKKTKRWLAEAPSDAQLKHLGLEPMQALGLGVTRYRATCALTWKWNERAIQAKLLAA